MVEALQPLFLNTHADELENSPLLLNASKQTSAQCPKKPFALAFRSSKSFVTFVVCAAVFSDTFLYTLIIPILPKTLTEQAGVSRNEVQYWISLLLGVYGATNLIMSPIAGYFADRASSRRSPLLFGLCTLAASITMYSFGHTPLILVTARALQGASAAIVQVVGLALLSDTMGATNAGGAMGWQAMGMFAGTALGPSLAGVVFDVYGHYAVFSVAYAVLIVDIILRFVMVERRVACRWLHLDRNETYGTIEGIASENPREQDLVDHHDLQKSGLSHTACEANQLGISSLLRSPRILMALWATFVCAVLMTALESVMPLYVMDLFIWTPSQSGFLFILLAFSIILDPYIGNLTDQKGPRIMSMTGFCSGILIWLGFSFITENSLGDKILLSTLLFALGFSIGFIQTPNMVEVSLAVDDLHRVSLSSYNPAKLMGRAYSLLNMAYGIGSVIGPLWGGFLAQHSGWQVLCGSFVALNVGSAFLTWLFSGGGLSSEDARKTVAGTEVV